MAIPREVAPYQIQQSEPRLLEKVRIIRAPQLQDFEYEPQSPRPRLRIDLRSTVDSTRIRYEIESY